MNIRGTIWLWAALVAAPIAAGAQEPDHAAILAGARAEGSLAVASSAPGEGFAKFMQAFARKYPFLDVTSGFYSAPTGRVLARVRAELDAHKVSFDVMLAANTAAFLELQEQKQLLHYASPEYAAFPPQAKQDGYWGAAQAIGVIIAYNRNVLPDAQAPHSWADLLDPRFANHKLATQNAASGTEFNQIYLLEKALGPDYIRRLGAQHPAVMATSAQVNDAMLRGEILAGASVDHWRAFQPEAVQAGIQAVYPTEGMPLALAPVAILAAAPHPNAARLFLDFILSKEGQTLFNPTLYGVYSIRDDVPPPAGQKKLADTKPMLPTDLADYRRASASFPEHFDSIFQ
jgi:iron(III) transport system substrate-binding protein